MLLARVKTIAYLLIVAFLIYAIFKSPDQAASIVRTAWDGVVDGLHAMDPRAPPLRRDLRRAPPCETGLAMATRSRVRSSGEAATC